MIDYTNAYISKAVYLAAFKPDTKIRYKQEQIENAFSSFISAQSQSTNLPDDYDAAQPRFVFQTTTKQLLISQIACQLSMGFENAQTSLEQQLSIVQNNSLEFHKRVTTFKDKESLKENAFILSISIPSEASREDLGDLLFKKFIKLPKFSKIASTSLTVGYQLPSNLFLNIEADIYEKRSGIVQGGQAVDVMSLPVIEQGITLKLDVNSRPQALLPNYSNEGPEEIISVVNEYFPQHLLQLVQLDQTV